MEEVARAMENAIRMYSNNRPSWYAQGVTWHATTCVRVRWKWITFLVIMVSVPGILLVLCESRDVESDRLWESSILTAFSCELEMLQDSATGKGEMIKVTNSTSVSLQGNGSSVLRLLAR